MSPSDPNRVHIHNRVKRLGDLSRAETRTAIAVPLSRSHHPETTTLQRSTESDYLDRHSTVTATTSYPQAVEKNARPPSPTGLEERPRGRETIWRNRRPSVSHRLRAIGGSAPASGPFRPVGDCFDCCPLGPTSMTTDTTREGLGRHLHQSEANGNRSYHRHSSRVHALRFVCV